MKVFLLAGQSNMRGQSYTNKLNVVKPIKNCIYYENSQKQSRIGYTIKLTPTEKAAICHKARKRSTMIRDVAITDPVSDHYKSYVNDLISSFEDIGIFMHESETGFADRIQEFFLDHYKSYVNDLISSFKDTDIFTHGPEIGFAGRMQELLKGDKFVIVKYSENGSSLYDWDPNWTIKKAKITGSKSYGPLFNKSLNVLDAVLKHHQTQLSGICWMQGCRDSKFEDPAAEYFNNFKFLIESFRNHYDMTSANIPVVFGKISPPNDGRFPYKDIVRLHQDRASIEIPNLTMISTDDFSKPDNLHYSLDSNLLLGKNFANAMSEMI